MNSFLPSGLWNLFNKLRFGNRTEVEGQLFICERLEFLQQQSPLGGHCKKSLSLRKRVM